jgi:hypothetical protein
VTNGPSPLAEAGQKGEADESDQALNEEEYNEEKPKLVAPCHIRLQSLPDIPLYSAVHTS